MILDDLSLKGKVALITGGGSGIGRGGSLNRLCLRSS